VYLTSEHRYALANHRRCTEKVMRISALIMNSSFGASFLSKFDFEGGEECLRVKKLVILGELSGFG
jgi:hypothetical protein